MFKVNFQFHGCPEVFTKEFLFRCNLDYWIKISSYRTSFVKIVEGESK